jgi:hypothetical protein
LQQLGPKYPEELLPDLSPPLELRGIDAVVSGGEVRHRQVSGLADPSIYSRQHAIIELSPECRLSELSDTSINRKRFSWSGQSEVNDFLVADLHRSLATRKSNSGTERPVTPIAELTGSEPPYPTSSFVDRSSLQTLPYQNNGLLSLEERRSEEIESKDQDRGHDTPFQCQDYDLYRSPSPVHHDRSPLILELESTCQGSLGVESESRGWTEDQKDEWQDAQEWQDAETQF